MDIPAVTSLPPNALPGILPASPIDTSDTLALGTTGENDPLALNQTTVDLSPLGQFFSATSAFQKQILSLQAARGGVSEAVDPVLDANAVAASAASLADTFNQLQTGSPVQPQDGQSFAALFAQQFGAQTVPAGETIADPAALAAIGLTFDDTPAPVAVSTLTVDQPVLIQALAENPAPTAALLGQTAAALGALTGVTPEEPTDQVFRTEAEFLTLPANATATTAPNVADASVQAGASQVDTLKAAQASAEEHLADAHLAEDLAQTRSTSTLLEQQRATLANAEAGSEAQRLQEAQIQAQLDQLHLDRKVADDRTLEQQDKDVAILDGAPQTLANGNVVTTTTAVATADTPALMTANPQLAPDPGQQLARDPAIAAAIAAYNLHTGPFAVLNGRPELAAPRIKPVAPVSEVTRVTPVDASTDLKSGAREFR
jgi:hypothetical protein